MIARLGLFDGAGRDEEGNAGIQFGRLIRVPRNQRRPKCPVDPSHRVWRRNAPKANSQRGCWSCSVCGKFVNSSGRPHGIYPPEVVQEAIDLVLTGVSIRKAALSVGEKFGKFPSYDAVWSWVHKAGYRRREKKTMSGHSAQTREAEPLPDAELIEICSCQYGGSLYAMAKDLEERLKLSARSIDWRTRARIKADLARVRRIAEARSRGASRDCAIASAAEGAQ